ncbi:MAG: type IV secretory system conjugative DNA transfer family protein [Clostridia bacterium]|nr:type IV secretory system conjugative DNA transfer family protein [Clostridia bacterium]
MKDLKTRVMEEYISENMPDARLYDYRDAESDMSFYDIEELSRVSGDWFPLSCHLSPEGRAIYGGRSGVVHTYVQGDTGSGKTTRVCVQELRALAATADKPSFVVTDPHGEIAETLYDHLKNNGYEIRIVNCDEPGRSDTYNPLYRIAKEVYEREAISESHYADIHRIVGILIPIEDTKDPIWERGARSYTEGLMLDKLEDIRDRLMKPEKFTIYNIIQNHHWVKNKIGEMGYSVSLMNIPHFSKKGHSNRAVQKMLSTVIGAEKTRDSYFSVAEVNYERIGSSGFFALSSSSTVNVQTVFDKPTAIFIQSAVSDAADMLVSLLVNDIYTSIVESGKKQFGKQARRKIHCFLDEFANCNIAEDGKSFIKMLTTSRKFGMYWHMMLQCDAQIESKFDANVSRIIRANCSEIFIASNDISTCTRFSEGCGKRTTESLASLTADDDRPISLETVPLITAESLNLLPMGSMYVRSPRRSLMKTYFEAWYNCDEITPVRKLDSIYPVNRSKPESTVFYPDEADKAAESKVKWIRSTTGKS